MKTLKIIIPILFLLFVFDSCSKNDDIEIKQESEDTTSSSVNVYACGYEKAAEGWYITYWKNGVAKHLSYPNQKSEISASSIKVVGNDVYVAGFDRVRGVEVATYWKNDLFYNLSDGTKNTRTTSMEIVGSDVYVSGIEFDGAVNKAKYWKNNTEYTLATSYQTYANSIAVNGNDVYVVGSHLYNSKRRACYWKNGELFFLPTEDLSDAYALSEAYSIKINGSDIYITGFMIDGMGTRFAVYWKNDTLVKLTSGSGESIAVSGENVYVGGNIYARDNSVFPKLWKNGVITNLPFNDYSATVKSVALFGNDIYVVGYQEYNVYHDSNAILWKNGVASQISKLNSRAHSVFITP